MMEKQLAKPTCVAIAQPMLACAPGPGGVTTFPMLATPKIDGIRALMVRGSLVSRTLKPIPNRALRRALEALLPDGCDGELMHGDTFQSCTSAVMTRDGPKGGFTYYAFDLVCRPEQPYSERVAALQRVLSRVTSHAVVTIVVLVPVAIKDAGALDAYESEKLDAGFEGVIARRPDGHYKFGRSTPREALMLKIKRFEDAEARITGVEELVRAHADAHTDAHTDADEGERGSGLLGALVVERADGVSFRIGTGFTAMQRMVMWKSRASLVGRHVKYKFFRVGTVVAPRFPTFIGFRDARDM